MPDKDGFVTEEDIKVRRNDEDEIYHKQLRRP